MMFLASSCRKLVTLLAAAGLLITCSCGRRAPRTTPSPTEKVTILATVFPLADVARQVGGSHVSVSWVVEGGQSLSGLVPGADTRKQLRITELVLLGGATEPWADIGFGVQAQDRRIIRMDALDPNAPRVDGLLWLDPIAVENTTRELCNRLRVLRPNFDKDFEVQSDRFIGEVDALFQTYRPKFSGATTTKLLVLSPDFNPLLQRLSLWPVQSVTASPMQLGDAAIATLKQASIDNNTHLLLVPLDTPSATIRDIEVRAGLQTVRIDALGSSSAGGHNTYLEMLRFNLEQLLNATTIR